VLALLKTGDGGNGGAIVPARLVGGRSVMVLYGYGCWMLVLDLDLAVLVSVVVVQGVVQSVVLFLSVWCVVSAVVV
jgi:hypothetical protein